MAVLVTREYAAFRGSRHEPGYGRLLAGDFPYRDEWMEIYSGERRIGYISYSVWDSPPDGYEISAHSVVRMPALTAPLRLESTSIIDSEFKLEKLNARIVVPELVDMSVEGRVCGEMLDLEIRIGGELLHMTMDPRRVLFTDLFTPLYALDIGRVSGRKKMSVYDPLTGGNVELLVEAMGRRTMDISSRRIECREFMVTFGTIACSVFLDGKGRLLFIKIVGQPEELMIVNELLIGKGAGKELASLEVQNAECKMQNAK